MSEETSFRSEVLIGVTIVIVVGLIAASMTTCAYVGRTTRERFMVECSQTKPPSECALAWKQADDYR